ncbi:MAG TPA: cytochrome P450, partial [Myxococcota bacterium]|nr:cytochrome P450 [Myxococcota bacterium]
SAAYERDGYPHAAWARLRREDPVHWTERPDAVPFWAVTKHQDIVAVSRQPRLWQNAPRLAVFPGLEKEVEKRIAESGQPQQPEVRHLLNMDPPDHGRFRKLASSHFTPRALEPRRKAIEEISRAILDEFANGGEWSEADFVEGVSVKLPLAVLLDMLGVPAEDWKLMMQWTNETIGATDPEYQQGQSALETAERSRLQLFGYFMRMVDERRKKPTPDIVSLIANATLDGQHLPPIELLSFYYLLVVAGNETTRNATSGGLLALIQNPGELEKLRRDPSLIPSAVEEIVRFTSPVIQFCRTAARDTELRGRTIRAGQAACLFYPSANRDEDVFPDGERFRVDRDPNPHLAFGIGEHFCMGAHLARLELQVVLSQLVSRLEAVELAGPVRRLRSSFVGGVKSMPIRYRLRPSR